MKELSKDEVLEERYKVVKKIGSGGMANVYLVWDMRLMKFWALKEMQFEQEEKWRAQAFMKEAGVLKVICHKAIPVLIDTFEREDGYYMVMEFLEGETLTEYLKRKRRLGIGEALTIMEEVLDALSYLHRMSPKVIYGDLKPDNIMIQSNMGVKLMDFGSVMWGEDTNFVLGTVGYAAPEQLESESLFEVDERSDIYAVGAVFYEMLTGNKWNGRYMKNPFIAENVRRMIFKCTRLNPNERYQSISEVLDELRQVEKKDIVKDFFRIKKKPFLLEDKERTILVDWKGQIDSAPDKKE